MKTFPFFSSCLSCFHSLVVFLFSLFPVRFSASPLLELMLSLPAGTDIYTRLYLYFLHCYLSTAPLLIKNRLSARTHTVRRHTNTNTNAYKHYYYNVRHSLLCCFTEIALEYTVCTLSDNICLRGCHLTLSVDRTGDTIHRMSSWWPIVLHIVWSLDLNIQTRMYTYFIGTSNEKNG